jgi:hypothetical protein
MRLFTSSLRHHVSSIKHLSLSMMMLRWERSLQSPFLFIPTRHRCQHHDDAHNQQNRYQRLLQHDAANVMKMRHRGKTEDWGVHGARGLNRKWTRFGEEWSRSAAEGRFGVGEEKRLASENPIFAAARPFLKLIRKLPTVVTLSAPKGLSRSGNCGKTRDSLPAPNAFGASSE